jgi:hypothetical protein
VRTIWKYVLLERGLNQVAMPANAEILHVGMQGGRPCIWAQVESTNETEERFLWVHGTGWDISDTPVGQRYLGTAQTDDSLVWHVFESHTLSS